MKNFTQTLLFISALGFVISATAKDEHAASPAKDGHQAKAGGRDNNALFPPKQPNKALSTTPADPQLVSPEFMKTVREPSVTLTWKEVEGAQKYHVQVATDPNFKWLKADENLYQGTSLEVKNLEAGKHYYWRVAAVKPDNMSTYMTGNFSKSMFQTPEAK